MNRITRPIIMLSTLLMLASSYSNAATIYKWVDDKGVPQYSAMPPSDRPFEKIKSYSSSSKSSSNSDAKQKADSPAKAATQTPQVAASKKDPERCAIAKRNLQTLKNNSRIKIKGEDGEMRFLDQQEIMDKRKESEQAVADSC